MLTDITDISEFQHPGTGVGRDGVIVRACNGRREDYQVDAHVRFARTITPRVSLYAYCEPGTRSPEFTADLLCTVAHRVGVPPGSILWADIEEGGGNLLGYELAFVARCAQWGYGCRSYSGACFGPNAGLSALDWVASYGPNNGGVYPVRCGSRDVPWLLHQYTSAGGLDRNRGDETAVAQLFGGGLPHPAPPRKKVNEMIYVDDPDQGGTGTGWQIGVGFAETINDWPTYQRLSLVSADLGKLHPWKGIEWMQNRHAWNDAAQAPRRAA